MLGAYLSWGPFRGLGLREGQRNGLPAIWLKSKQVSTQLNSEWHWKARKYGPNRRAKQADLNRRFIVAMEDAGKFMVH